MTKRARTPVVAVPMDLLDAVARVPWDAPRLGVDDYPGFWARFDQLRTQRRAYVKACADAVQAASAVVQATAWPTAPAEMVAAAIGRVQLAGALTLRSRVVARGEIVALEWNATLADLLRQLPLPRGTRGLRGAALTFTYDGRTTFTVRRGTQTVSADLPAPMPATPPTGVCRLCGTPMPGSKGKWYCSDFCSSEAHRRLVAARRGRHATLP